MHGTLKLLTWTGNYLSVSPETGFSLCSHMLEFQGDISKSTVNIGQLNRDLHSQWATALLRRQFTAVASP
jgi:hypothetical protein